MSALNFIGATTHTGSGQEQFLAKREACDHVGSNPAVALKIFEALINCIQQMQCEILGVYTVGVAGWPVKSMSLWLGWFDSISPQYFIHASDVGCVEIKGFSYVL
jgi:hypothetical protein